MYIPLDYASLRDFLVLHILLQVFTCLSPVPLICARTNMLAGRNPGSGLQECEFQSLQNWHDEWICRTATKYNMKLRCGCLGCLLALMGENKYLSSCIVHRVVLLLMHFLLHTSAEVRFSNFVIHFALLLLYTLKDAHTRHPMI